MTPEVLNEVATNSFLSFLTKNWLLILIGMIVLIIKVRMK